MNMVKTIPLADMSKLNESAEQKAARLEKELYMVCSALETCLDPGGSHDYMSAVNAVNRITEIRRRLDGQESLQLGNLRKELRLQEYRVQDVMAETDRLHEDLRLTKKRLETAEQETDRLNQRLALAESAAAELLKAMKPFAIAIDAADRSTTDHYARKVHIAAKQLSYQDFARARQLVADHSPGHNHDD